MTENSKKSKSEAPILTTPEGVKIQVTAGRKLQQIRALMRDPEISDAQFRVLSCLIDRLNDGKKDHESRWGSAYPRYEKLADDVAKDVRATKRIIKELETGQRETRTGGVTKLVSCKAALNVERNKDESGQDKSNQYRLKEWGAFVVKADGEGAVPSPLPSGEGAVTGEGGCGDLSEGVRSPVREGAVPSPDSTHLLISKFNSQDSSASGGRPAASQVQRKEANDNDRSSPDDDLNQGEPDACNDNADTKRYREAATRVWSAYPVRPEKDRRKFINLFVEKCVAGIIKGSNEVLDGMKLYLARIDDPKYVMNPIRFIQEDTWKNYSRIGSGMSGVRGRMKMAI